MHKRPKINDAWLILSLSVRLASQEGLCSKELVSRVVSYLVGRWVG